MVTTTRLERGAGAPTLAVHDWGGDGDPVLLCHATGFHGLVWEPVAVRLRDAGRHVWSFDFRGHGDSGPAPDGEYAWSRYGDDARDVARHLGIDGAADALAVGHSKGAAAILLADEDAPGTFARAWCFEPIVIPTGDETPPPDHDFPLAVGARRRRASWGSPDEALASYASRPPLDVLHPDALRAYIDAGLQPEDDGTWTLKCSPEAEASTYAHGVAHGLWNRLDTITAQVRVVCGETTDAVGPRLAEAIAARLAHGSVEVMTGLGHFGPLEDPEAAVASILAFDAASESGRIVP
jgi:pimeloyl-ACP methyl ester carboxylesterase